MEKLPNELHGMIVSHLCVKDLRSYRLVNRRSESVANRLLFETVRFVFDHNLSTSFTIRPAIAQFIKRVHIDTNDGMKGSYDRALQLKNLIQHLTSAGATITELFLFMLEEYQRYPCDPPKGFDIEEHRAEYGLGPNDPLGLYTQHTERKTVERYMAVLAESASLLSDVTHFHIDNFDDMGKNDIWTTEYAFRSLFKVLKSLEKLQCVDLSLAYDPPTDEKAFGELLDIFDGFSDNCPKPQKCALEDIVDDTGSDCLCCARWGSQLVFGYGQDQGFKDRYAIWMRLKVELHGSSDPDAHGYWLTKISHEDYTDEIDEDEDEDDDQYDSDWVEEDDLLDRIPKTSRRSLFL